MSYSTQTRNSKVMIYDIVLAVVDQIIDLSSLTRT